MCYCTSYHFCWKTSWTTGGTRTRNPRLTHFHCSQVAVNRHRRPMPYPLGHGGCIFTPFGAPKVLLFIYSIMLRCRPFLVILECHFAQKSIRFDLETIKALIILLLNLIRGLLCPLGAIYVSQMICKLKHLVNTKVQGSIPAWDSQMKSYLGSQNGANGFSITPFFWL